MFSYPLMLGFSFSIAIATFIGLLRLKKIEKMYEPFILYLSLGLLNEVISSIVIPIYQNNALNANIYVLLAGLTLLWLFQKWGSYGRETFLVLSILLTITWVAENLLISTLFRFNSFYRIVYSLLAVFFSVDRLNNLLLFERKNLLKNAQFIICATFILFFTFKATYEVFFWIRIKASNDFYKSLFLILVFTNLISNLLYALATLWIPTKQKFSSPY